jgi:ubiquitin thioesterase OTU1
MRIRVRGPNGQSVITLPATASIAELQAQITEKTAIKSFDVKYGYPPKPLELTSLPSESSLDALDAKLDGEQLIVSERIDGSEVLVGNEPSPTGNSAESAHLKNQSTQPSLDAKSTPRKPPSLLSPLSLTRKAPPVDAPELPLPSHGGTLVLRIMPDDNSCLFRAFNSAYFGVMDNMYELRSIIAQNIQANTDIYSKVVLDQDPDDYCRWIQTEDAWGGAIELDILSKHFDVEVCSIDVQSLRVDRYNEGRENRCILVYSGIHYDVIALSPSEPPYDHAYAPPEFDTKIFNADDAAVLVQAVELCRILQGQHYFTDTAGFKVRCNVCKAEFKGEKGATAHAAKTGHYDFGEAG